MGRLRDAKYDFDKQNEKAVIENVIERLKFAVELKEQGRVEERDKVVNEVRIWIEDKIQELEKRVNPEMEMPHKCFVFPKEGEIVAVGNKVVLRVINADEKEKYLAVSYEYSFMKGAFKKESFRDSLWEEFISDNAFVCSVYEKVSGEYIGYCSIKNLLKEEWELAIELKSSECHKGYGTEALSLFMKEVNKLTGRRFFRARVELDNHASQKLMKKLGAIPNGISEFMLHGEEINVFQETYKHMITDEIREVAADFCMDAEDMLGYVLEYRFDMMNSNC